jgi:hypothetical protein
LARSSLSLDACWRDYYGMWNPYVEPLFAPIEESICHAPRYALIPDVEHQLMPDGGKIEYNFHLVPGSLIVGFWVTTSTNYPGNSGNNFAIQLRDIELEHNFFQDPSDTDFLVTEGAQFGRFPSITLLPCPHPVAGDGLFSLEVWGTPGDTFVMVLLVAEVTDCPVR